MEIAGRKPTRWPYHAGALCLAALVIHCASFAAAGAPDAPPARRDLVTNVWVETELHQVLGDIASQTGTTIVADQTVQGIISMAVQNMPLEECLERVCAVGGYTFLRVKDYYIVGRADPNTQLFQKVAGLQRHKLCYVSTDLVKAMLPPTLSQYVTYDKINGAILVHAPDAIKDRVLEAVKVIDAPKQQIAVEAIVFELSEEGSKQLALDWQYKNNHLKLQSENLIGTITYDAASDFASYVDVTLRAIVQSQKGQVLANPRIVVLNGNEAEIFIGQEKYFSLLSGQAFNPYYRLESIKSGVTLKVTPYIGDDDQVTVDFEAEVSDVVKDWTREPSDGEDALQTGTLPVVTRRKAKTSVAIRDGQTVAIGGLLRDQHRGMVEKTPILGDLPFAGAAFRNVRDLKEQKEVVILITAHLKRGDPDQQATDMASHLQQRYVSPLDAMGVDVYGAKRWPRKP
jgi:type IV pilus assembly protein PilQ